MVASTAFSGTAKPAAVSAARAARLELARAESLRDAELVRRFNAGDEGAFVELVGLYRAKLCSVALSLLKNRDDADEVAQDAFVRAHRALPRFRGESSLGTWLHQIALNLARNRYWHNFRRRRHVTLSLDSAFSDDNQATFASLAICPAPGPTRATTTDEFTRLVAACMEELSPGHREILVCRTVRNWSYGQIARACGVSVGTVKSRVARARASLRVLIAKACPEFTAHASPRDWFEPVRPSGGLEAICA